MAVINKDFLSVVLGKANGRKIAIIGDVMLDRFFWGRVSRISPEAPVPVVDIEKESYHLGGAANVASNLKSLGINPILFGVVGNDSSAERFEGIAKDLGIDCRGLYHDNSRPTIVKTRIIGNNQHIVRLDREIRSPISQEGEELIINSIQSINDLSGIIFGDYDKGAISENMISSIIAYAVDKAIPVYVDPKFDNFFAYKNATFFKPNKKEAAKALQIEINNKENLIATGKKLLEILEVENILLTLGSKGMMIFENNGNISSIPTIARHISDVSGAGDTAIATLAAAIAGGAKTTDAAMLANFASGAVCEMPGVVSISIDSLTKAINKSRNLSLNLEIINY